MAIFSAVANMFLLALFCAYNCHKPLYLRKMTEEEKAILALESIPGIGTVSTACLYKGELHPEPKLSMFCALKIINTFV